MSSAVLDAVPKSILKKTRKAPAPPATSKPSAREKRNYELALQHAQLIQQRKDVESAILVAIETLLDFPPSTSSNATQPSVADSNTVKDLLKPFQPSDYDSLIEERNIDGKCGYCLCPKPHKVEPTKGRFRILRTGGDGGKGMKIVEKAELEKWCSDACAKMALYIRVQLSEVPAWERTGTGAGNIEVLGASVSSRVPQSDIADDVEELTAGLKQLAVERGQNKGGQGTKVIEPIIRDKEVLHEPDENYGMQEDDYHESSNIYDLVEGYAPKTGSRRRRRHEEGEDGGDDLMDTI
jgi:hypothetical protein